MRSLHTPQQETNVAYNPGVSYRGGEFIAQGISQAGNAISSGISSAMAQFTKNREERDYMDERMKSVAANLAQFRDFETDAADDKSPAGTLLKAFSNWDNKPLAAKKAALVDADHLISKGERNLERARAEQFQLLAVQDRQAAAENLQKHQADMLGVSRQGMALEGIRTLGGLFNQSQDNARANKRLTLEETSNARVEAERAKARAKEDAFFTQAAQGYDLADKYPGVALPMTSERLAQFGASTGGISPQALINLAEFSERRNDPIARDAAETARINALASRMNAENNQPKPWWMGAAGKALPEPRDGYAALPDGRGGFTWKAQKKADGTVSAAIPAEMQTKMDTLLNEITEDEAQIAAGDTRSWYGGSRADRLKENKARLAVFQRNYGGAPAPGPASGGSRFKVEEMK